MNLNLNLNLNLNIGSSAPDPAEEPGSLLPARTRLWSVRAGGGRDLALDSAFFDVDRDCGDCDGTILGCTHHEAL